MHPTRVLVTGGAGFIGSHVVEALLREEVEVHVLDNLSTGTRANVPERARLFQGDILDDALTARALEGVDGVIHLAARVAIRDSIENFDADARTNLMGTIQLLRACGERKVRKIVFASSMAVYADSPTPLPVSETAAQEPISPYGISKLAAEKYVHLMSRLYDMQSVCLRYFNVFGPRQSYTPYVGVITIFIERLLQGRPPVIFGDGEQQRDFVHVGDIARATLLALRSTRTGETFNVGTGTGTSVNQIARLLIEKLAPGLDPAHADAHAGEIRNSIADISRIRDALGFEPRATLQDRIDEVIAWKQNTRVA